MPNFDKLKFTNKGLEIQTSAQAGSVLTFSKIKIGNGAYTGDVANLTELVSPMLEASIIAGTLSDKTYTVESSFVNDGLQTGFYWSEIGLYVKDSSGNDVLYAYSSASGSTDYVPSESESGYLKRIKIAIAVGNATTIEFVKSEGVFVDVLTFNEKIEAINLSLSEIKEQLGSFATSKELETSVKDINQKITNVANDLTKLSNAVTEMKEQIIGSTNISGIGNGTLTGAVAELYRLIGLIPSITSGTTEPTGGEDGDVYIMYEE